MKKHITMYLFKRLHFVAIIIVTTILIAATQENDYGKENMQAYLKETHFCDFNNPAFNSLSIDESKPDREIAVEIFYLVRDKLALGVDSLGVRASDVLIREKGACWNKALLMVALLRKYEIPGKIVKVPLNHNFLEPLAGENIKYINNPFYHCFVQVYLDGKWIYADPSIDINNYKTYYLPLKLSWNMDWDGKSNHIIHTGKFMGPFEIIEDIDHAYSSSIGNTSFD